ncbi:MAG: SLC13/DASS family transporter [Firmicutes bacterium]|nr:SLC13/DASS family transporter [Bacillota bacterium]
MGPAEISLIILAAVMILYITEIIPLAVTAIGSCAALVVFKVVDAKTAWSGLSDDTNLLIAGMIVVGLAMFETGLAEEIGKKIVSLAKGSTFGVVLAMLVVTMGLSAFLNNSSTTAMMVPVLAGIIAGSGGKINGKFTMMPLAIAAVTGGMLTLVGSTPPVIVQGVQTAAGYRPFGFFEFALIGGPICVAFLIYNFTIGKWLAVKMWGQNPPPSQALQDMMSLADAQKTGGKPKDPKKMWMSGIILLGCVLGFIFTNTKILPLGTIAMIGALACVVTGCISEKTTYRQMDWTTVLVLGGSIGFAAGLDKSGGGKLLANYILGLFGDKVTPYTILVVIAFLGMFLTQFMSNTAATAMLAPIGLAMAKAIGANPLPIMMALCTATASSFSTPVATPPMTIVLGPGGYKFFDYIKWGGLFNLFCFLLVIILVPLIWPF